MADFSPFWYNCFAENNRKKRKYTMFIMNVKQTFDNAIEDSFEKFIRRFKINSILRGIGAVKEKGVLTYLLFAFLLRLVFTHKNFYTTFSGGAKHFLSRKM